MNSIYKPIKEKQKQLLDYLKGSKKRIVIAIVLILALGFFGQKAFLQQQETPSYQTAKVEKGTIVSSISVSGQVLTANIVNINTNASGIISKVYVKDGDIVSAGDKIMEITLDQQGQQQNAQTYASYLSAQTSLESAKASLYSLQSTMYSKWKIFTDLAGNSTYQNPDGSPNTANRILTQFTIAQDDWLAAEANYKNQQNTINQAEAALNSTWLDYQISMPVVTAPILGMINNITYSEGMNIGSVSTTDDSSNSSQSQIRIAVIKNNNNPIATFNISEIDVSRVKPGQKATIKLDSISDKTFTGKVLTVDRIGTVTSGVTNYPVIIQFDSEAPEILPNMSATANIILEVKDNVLLIPSSVIQKQGDQSVVRVLKGKQEQTVTIGTGLVSDTQTEVLSGLSEGDEVVTSIATSGTSQSGGGSVFGGGGAGRIFMGR